MIRNFTNSCTDSTANIVLFLSLYIVHKFRLLVSYMLLLLLAYSLLLHFLLLTYRSLHLLPLTSMSPLMLPTLGKQAVWEAATVCPRPLQVDLWPFDHESGVRVTCDVGYLCANFSLPRPLCSQLRPDVLDRQTDIRRQTSHRRQSCIIITLCPLP